ncbi:alpha/beta hydrolase [Steroidobacter sp. S1-65]|uniref:Alpha/beta hydrolase n=1 Tax=Steroidobacter gossypii TaxID=2805490 RepID=A0ABS1WU62_9GAMM|nr:alpha/beta hydrolase [Steroidobacter gossypii]MBM0104510.1 alpha/beta hydrolase [Steroidobacter gossypii]
MTSSHSTTYRALRAPQNGSIEARGLKFHLYRWPGADPDPLVLLHGWGDSGETFQFLVDCLPAERTCIAIDLRGFGRTQRPVDGYWFPDYLADLDALLDQLVPDAPIDLVGHSMGGNIAMLYAGVRPQRLRRVISLEGFGMSRTTPEQAPARYAQWLDEVKHGSEFNVYQSYEQLVRVLARRNPRTPQDRLDFIARSWGQEREDGTIELRADPKHKRVNPVLYSREQAEACWRAIEAPLLFVLGEQSDLVKRMGDELEEHKLRALFRTGRFATIPDVGHMMHHERPEQVAAVIEEFLDGTRA